MLGSRDAIAVRRNVGDTCGSERTTSGVLLSGGCDLEALCDRDDTELHDIVGSYAAALHKAEVCDSDSQRQDTCWKCISRCAGCIERSKVAEWRSAKYQQRK